MFTSPISNIRLGLNTREHYHCLQEFIATLNEGMVRKLAIPALRRGVGSMEYINSLLLWPKGINSICKHLNFKIFWGGGGGNMPPNPPRKLAQWECLLQNLLTALIMGWCKTSQLFLCLKHKVLFSCSVLTFSHCLLKILQKLINNS